MKVRILLPVALLFFAACHQPATKQETSITPAAQAIPFETLEDIARYVSSMPFDSIAKDTMLNRKFKVNRTVVEDEGMDWDQYLFMHEQSVLFAVENNWENKTKVHKITFQDPKILTQRGVGADMPFSRIVAMMDTTKLNAAPDGYLMFQDNKDAHISYGFELSEDDPLFSGVDNLSEIPRTMRISYIVWYVER